MTQFALKTWLCPVRSVHICSFWIQTIRSEKAPYLFSHKFSFWIQILGHIIAASLIRNEAQRVSEGMIKSVFLGSANSQFKILESRRPFLRLETWALLGESLVRILKMREPQYCVSKENKSNDWPDLICLKTLIVTKWDNNSVWSAGNW